MNKTPTMVVIFSQMTRLLQRCSGTTAMFLAANSVFSNEQGAPRLLTKAGVWRVLVAASPKRRSRRRRHSKKRRSHKRRYSRKMKGGWGPVEVTDYRKGGASKNALKKRHSKKKRSHKRRYSRKLKGGMRTRHPPESTQIGGGTQLMNNICHSSGYSIGPVGTELMPTEVGLAALHYAPYTKTQNN